jgi:hypothetical protein
MNPETLLRKSERLLERSERWQALQYQQWKTWLVKQQKISVTTQTTWHRAPAGACNVSESN